MIGFERKRGIDSIINSRSLLGVQDSLDAIQVERYNKIISYWNFYEGYHWEDMSDLDSAEITVNFCRAFVDKFTAFELGKAFSFRTSPETEGVKVTPDGRTLFEYLEDVWEDNKQYEFCTDMGQMKSVTGEAWIQVRYYTPEEVDDPYNEYPNGRLRVMLMPSSVIFPDYNPHDRDVIDRVTILYAYETLVKTPILGRMRKETKIFRQVWTKDECVTEDGINEPVVTPNRYGVIPFVCIKNLPISGRTEGRSDLEDIIPLNVEYNLKRSNMSEILDYHAAPITLVYGAKIGNLEKGANKVWGGLAKDSRVENLELHSDMSSSTQYIKDLKVSMCEVGGIPETVLGGAQAVSNTSGVALQYINLPLIEKTRMKRQRTETGLENLNKLIILVSLLEGLIIRPSNITNRDFYRTEVTVPDTLPKDTLLELQQIEQELKLHLESRYNAMKRLGKENIEELIAEIDEERKKDPAIFGDEPQVPEVNSGFLNGQTAIEEVRKEVTGSNGVINE